MAETKMADAAHGAEPASTGADAVTKTTGSKEGDAKEEEAEAEQQANPVFQITVNLPHKPYKIPVMVSVQEQVQDLRQSIVEQADTFQYSCFHLEHDGAPINDFVELSEVTGLSEGSEVKLVEDPYTEKEARLHMVRVRDLIGASGDRVDTAQGVCAGLSLLDSVAPQEVPGSQKQNGSVNKSDDAKKSHPMQEYDFDAPAAVKTVLPPKVEPPPKTVKALTLSPWNPPPHHLRQKGHLLYLQLTTNEGEQFQITSHLSGFFVNKSSNSKFDPFVRAGSKSTSAHSLLSLISKLSPSFDATFLALLEYNGRRDPLANFQITHAIPASPWLVSPAESALTAHQPDMTRSQETYLISGVESTENLRDWNEEFQSTREQPRDTVQDRVFRERITSKLFADYNEAAIRGAIMCARGEIAPLNPTEKTISQIFVYNSIFFSFGADGPGTFTTEGGDAAARAAVGKDVAGVRMVNQLDIDGLFAPGTVIVDYLGKRVVCQSLVPGIFKQREPEEHQVNYGGLEGRNVIAADEGFVPVFSKLSKAMRVKRHDVWDKDGKKFTLEGSIETKGMLGTDARRYVLDLYRLTPLDIAWIEDYWSDETEGEEKPRERNYPHRMGLLRPELIEAFWRSKMTEYVKQEVQKRKEESAKQKSVTDGKKGATEEVESDAKATDQQQERVDISGFDFTFNPDVCCGQVPQTAEEKQEWVDDERRVRDACTYLQETVLPELVKDLNEGDVGFPMDGQSLSRLMHKRGINLRYLGKLAELARLKTSRLDALAALATQEMISRAFKHVSNRYMQDLPAVFATSCYAHLLNCLLGMEYNKTPKPVVDVEMRSLYSDANLTYEKLDPKTLQDEIRDEVFTRYRFELEDAWVSKMKSLQMLREVSIKLGLQLTAKDYSFVAKSETVPQTTLATNSNGAVNGNSGSANNSKKNKKKAADSESMKQSTESPVQASPTTFEPDDIVNLAPVVKDSSPRSMLAEEALEAGRISLAQDQKELGQELLLESLSLHEQIYGILHPEVARVYYQLSMLYYSLGIKDAAAELARKAVILSERTLGLDHNETVLSYLNLGLFEHANGNTEPALLYIRHALELWKLIYGIKHPDSITTMNNAAVMLQALKQYHASRIWFEKSLTISEEVSGKDSVNTATLSFQLAQALALDQDAKAAVNRMREAYSIFHAKLGPDDRNTKESESWLEQLTQNAVSIAKHAKDVQARRLRRVQMTPRVTLGTQPQPQAGQSSSDMSGVNAGRDRGASIGVDARNVDELIKFIEGGGDSTKSTPKKRSHNHPNKRRGGSAQGGK